MAKYTDFQLECGPYGRALEYSDSNAIILAIRNILLSKPGNFPFNPSIGMNIKQYQFDLLDQETVSEIQRELNREIAKLIPELEDVAVAVQRVEGSSGKAYLGISVKVSSNGEDTTANFLLKEEGDTVGVFNEIY